MSAKVKLSGLLTALVLISAGLFSLEGEARRKSKDPDLQKREYMVKISRELGVTCAYCHDTQNLRKGNKKTFKIALKHQRITDMLNGKAAFAGKPKVSCYLCHRGKAKPDYVPPKLK